MKVLMGVGNPLREDDGIGPYIARKFAKDGWISIDCGPTPENFVIKVEEMNPELIVIVDAAQMNLSPGEIRKIPVEKIDMLAISTHNIPLSVIVNYLGVDRCIIIGIEPDEMGYGEGLSPTAQKAANAVLDILNREDFDSIPSV